MWRTHEVRSMMPHLMVGYQPQHLSQGSKMLRRAA